MQRPSITLCSTLACSGVTSTAWVSAIVARTASDQAMTSTTIAMTAPIEEPDPDRPGGEDPDRGAEDPDEQELGREHDQRSAPVLGDQLDVGDGFGASHSATIVARCRSDRPDHALTIRMARALAS